METNHEDNWNNAAPRTHCADYTAICAATLLTARLVTIFYNRMGGLVKEVNTFCDVIRGDNIDIMEDIIVDTGDIVGGQTRSDNESYNDNNNIDNTNNHNNNLHSCSFKHFLHLFMMTNKSIVLF